MQIYDLDDYELDLCGPEGRIVGGKTSKAIALGSASSIAIGDITVTKTLTVTQISPTRYQANSTGSASALSISSLYRVPTSSGILAFGRATVSSLGIARI
jgi:hypothetical protein